MREEKTEKDHYYHIYNIGINGGLIFKREDNILYNPYGKALCRKNKYSSLSLT